MLNRWLFFLLIVGPFELAFAQSTARTPNPTSAHSTLQLILNTEHDLYRISDTLQMETRLANFGDKDVYIWEQDMCWNPAHGLSMRITTSAEKDVQSPFLLDCLPPPPREGDVYQFVKIHTMRSTDMSTDSKFRTW
jgi:hypothetical protein